LALFERVCHDHFAEMADSAPGAQLGKYSLIAEIARGGMGIVYLAQASGRHMIVEVVSKI